VPIVLGVIPDPSGQRTKWSGDQINVNLDLNGAKLDAAASTLTVDGKPITLSTPASLVYLAPANPTLQMLWNDPKFAKGEFSFEIALFSQKGVPLQIYDSTNNKIGDKYSWTFKSEGEASGGSLINVDVMREWFWYIAAGSIVTVELTVISIALACLFALFGSLGRLSKKMSFKQAWDRYQSREYMFRMVFGRIPYWIATFYTSLFRGTPLLLQIFVIYQGAPEVIKAFGLPESYNPPAFWSGVAALSLNYGAYLTEVFRAGIQAVPKGQNEAAWAIGLSGWQTQRRIVLPQAFKIVIPAVGNDSSPSSRTPRWSRSSPSRNSCAAPSLPSRPRSTTSRPCWWRRPSTWALTIFFSFWQAKLETRMARDKAREKEKGKKQHGGIYLDSHLRRRGP